MQVKKLKIGYPTSIWTGLGGDDNWTTAANWDRLPASGSHLQFGGTTRLTPNNDFPPDTVFSSIEFLPGAGAFTIGGNGITRIGDLTNNSANLQTVTYDVILPYVRLINTVTGDILSNATMSGEGGITKVGPGTLTLTGQNSSFAGATLVNEGTLVVNGENTPQAAFGASRQIVINDGATIRIETANALVGWSPAYQTGPTTLVNNGGTLSIINGETAHLGPVILDGGVMTADVANHIWGNWNFNNTVSTPGTGRMSTISGGNLSLVGNPPDETGDIQFNIGNGDILNVTSVIDSPPVADTDVGLTKTGPGVLIAGSANAHIMPWTISAGAILVTGSTNAGSAIEVKNGGTLGGTGTINGPVTVRNGGTIAPGYLNTYALGRQDAGTSLTAGELKTWIEKGALPVGSILKAVSINNRLDAATADSWASDLCAYFDPHPESPTTNALLQIGGYNDLGTVTTHIYWANGDNGVGAQSIDTKIAGADFPAGIDLHDVQLSVGNGYGGSDGWWSGTITVTYNDPATLNTANVTFVSGSYYSVDLDGTTPTFDQINSSGTVTLGVTQHPILVVASLANSANGKVYTIINAVSVSGVFRGLADNDTFVAFGRTLRINYTATQVTLTDVT